MDEPEKTQIYLITPPSFELSVFNNDISALLDAFEIACLRLRMSSDDSDDIGRAADLLRNTCHQRDVPLIIESHAKLVTPHGLDGVHLTDGPAQIRALRKELGDEAVIGSFCGNSRHSGMTAGEVSADYIAFGPASETPLGTGAPVDFETLEWWSEVVEVPAVLEGGLTLEIAEKFAPVTDFIALGSEVWHAPEGAAKALQSYVERIS